MPLLSVTTRARIRGEELLPLETFSPLTRAWLRRTNILLLINFSPL